MCVLSVVTWLPALLLCGRFLHAGLKTTPAWPLSAAFPAHAHTATSTRCTSPQAKLQQAPNPPEVALLHHEEGVARVAAAEDRLPCREGAVGHAARQLEQLLLRQVEQDGHLEGEGCAPGVEGCEVLLACAEVQA